MSEKGLREWKADRKGNLVVGAKILSPSMYAPRIVEGSKHYVP
jgi:hypothetical protein